MSFTIKGRFPAPIHLLCTGKLREQVQPASSKLAARLLLGIFAAAAALPLVAQSSPGNDLSAYTQAVAHVQASDRRLMLESFALHTRSQPLKVDALEFVIWEYLRVRDISHAVTWANELATTDQDNPLALALITQSARNAPGGDHSRPERQLAIASRGLNNLTQLRRPLGMNHADFVELTRQATAMLNASAGWSELKLKDYPPARAYFRNAVAVDPSNPQNVYGLALADLQGPQADTREGYWYLARAVNLSRGTPQGNEMARFASERYTQDGGTANNWNQFLAAATPNAPATPSAVMASASAPPVRAATAPGPTVARTKPPLPAPSNPQPAPSIYADDTTPTPPVARRHPAPTANGPISLGILVETSLTDKTNRAALVNGLSDMLRHMSDDDEAFILTYDHNLVFEQDLTSDPKQLEEAMESIKPQRGAVLDDAIAFSAGHLARIAKYRNRVLLVISDGRNADSHSSPLQTSAEINAAGVRIYCIGVEVAENDGRYRLQALSSSTGGRSSFVSDPRQFRAATREMAQNMGIDFRF
jgi:hypothetical protein